LNQQQLLPNDRLGPVVRRSFGQPLNAGTLAVANKWTLAHLAPSARALVRRVAQAPVVHLDESGLRAAGALHWLPVAATTDWTLHEVHPKRGSEAMAALGVIGACRQWVVSDHWKPHFTNPKCLHALCNHHFLRELEFLWKEQLEGVRGN
jgi:transposase